MGWREKDQYVLIPIKKQQKITAHSQFYEEDNMLCHGYLCEIKKMALSQTYRKSSCSWTKLFILKRHYSTHMHYFLCCLLQRLLCAQWTYNNLSSEYNRWLNWDMRRNLLWCFCRKICSNSWKMKQPCLRDIGRVLVILCLQTSGFNTAVHDCSHWSPFYCIMTQ